ncbi:MAG: hypothetical protein LBU73_01505 [Helicobacteraceae bacterium]|jgi:OOP family OmpA-OmpF porin|nr:hypothetical protein [Helicobacteraceae bacterium]
MNSEEIALPPEVLSETIAEKPAAAQKKARSEIPEAPSDPEAQQLRELLFAREIAIVENLRKLFGEEANAKDLTQLIADSIAKTAGKDDRFTYTILPAVEKIVRQSMHDNKQAFIDVLFPLIGPSIRKSIAENFRDMLNNFSRTLENSLSWQGIRWRLEALRSGKTFSEVVLLRTIIYRVEQAFLIHAETGLVLSHIVNTEVESQDADMLSAMLTAINDFVKDVFRQNGSQSTNLESLRMGEFNIIIERQKDIYIACVVRGAPPMSLYDRVNDALDRIGAEFAQQIREFDGDTAPFGYANTFLEPLLDARYASEHKPFPTWGKVITSVALTFLIFGGVYFIYREIVFNKEFNIILNRLQDAQGVMLVGQSETTDGKVRLTLMRDEFAKPIYEIVGDIKSARDIRFEEIPYVSVENEIVYRRILSQLKVPQGAEFFYDNGVASLYGEATTEWIDDAKRILQSTAGVKEINAENISDPELVYVLDMIDRIEACVIEFPFNKSQPVGANAAEFLRLADMLAELEYAASKIGFLPNVVIYGHADSSGTALRNYELSRERGAALAALLYARGSAIPISVYGMGSDHPKEGSKTSGNADQKSRRIEIKVRLLRSTHSNLS